MKWQWNIRRNNKGVPIKDFFEYLLLKFSVAVSVVRQLAECLGRPRRLYSVHPVTFAGWLQNVGLFWSLEKIIKLYFQVWVAQWQFNIEKHVVPSPYLLSTIALMPVEMLIALFFGAL